MTTEKNPTGMFWHCHHDILCEWCYDYQERVDYIKREKSKNEIESRLRLFKPVKNVKALPKEFVEACKKWDEADKKMAEACKKWDEACKKRAEADKKRAEACKKYLPELEKLHKEECGCQEWNSEKQELEFK